MFDKLKGPDKEKLKEDLIFQLGFYDYCLDFLTDFLYLGGPSEDFSVDFSKLKNYCDFAKKTRSQLKTFLQSLN